MELDCDFGRAEAAWLTADDQPSQLSRRWTKWLPDPESGQRFASFKSYLKNGWNSSAASHSVAAATVDTGGLAGSYQSAVGCVVEARAAVSSPADWAPINHHHQKDSDTLQSRKSTDCRLHGQSSPRPSTSDYTRPLVSC